jgi:hypothetical protein
MGFGLSGLDFSGNANLLIGAAKNANREIGVPGLAVSKACEAFVPGGRRCRCLIKMQTG